MSQPRVALVHDVLAHAGGAERVLDAFRQLWPTAPIYTLYYDPRRLGGRYASADIRPSFIQRLPKVPPADYKWYLPFMPTAIERLDLQDYDLVISDVSAFAKGVITHHPTLHICYLYTPTRYLWTEPASYLRTAPVPGLLKPLMGPVLKQLRAWDYRAAQRPDVLVAISQTVAERCRRFYQREPDAVLFPPVDLRTFTLSRHPGAYWLVVAQQEPAKRTDLAIAAANQLGLPLKVVGTGSALRAYQALAGPTVEFLGQVPDADLNAIYARAIGLIFPQLEDAGITPLEAMAVGKPVIAFQAGGATESVVAGVTGEFFSEQTVDNLVAALRRFQPERYQPAVLRRHAAQFDTSQFLKRFQALVATARRLKEESDGRQP